MSTTGTFTQTANSATAARFQNAAGTTTVLVVDTTNYRVGVGAAPGTTFEVQGTASASYFLTGNTLQVNGFASAAYSRFGINTTTGGFLTNANDLLISGRFEVDASAQFDKKIEIQGTASASYFLTANTIQVGGNASVAYSRFGTNTTTHVGTISGANDLLISGGLEVNGSVAFDGFALFSAKASVTTDFEAGGYASSNDNFVSRNLIVGHRVASSSSKYSAEFGGGNNTATVSLLFGGSSPATTGTCLQMKNTAGKWVYLRITGTSSTSLVIDISPCHQNN